MNNWIFYLLLSLIPFIHACSSTPQEPLRVPVRERIPEQAGPIQLRTIAFLQDEHARPMEDVEVVLTAGNSRIRGRSGPSGAVSLKVPYLARQALDFEFRQGDAYWVYRVDNVPTGVDSVRVYFTLEQSGDVSFSRLEY